MVPTKNEIGAVATGKFFQKVEDPMSLFTILESRLPHSCCLINLLLAYTKFKDNIKAYIFEQDVGIKSDQTVLQNGNANGSVLANGNPEKGSNLWILFNYHREDWNACVTISSPIPTAAADEIPDEVKHALEFSGMLDWNERFVFLNVDLNVSDFLIKLNTRKFGNVIKIFPCYLFYMDPKDAAKIEVPSPTDPTVRVAPLDPIKAAEFLTKNWDYTGTGTKEFILNSVPNHISAGVYLPNGELACAAFMAAYGNVCTLVTHKDHRRKGYASLVIRYIFRELGKRGFHPSLETGITNHAGIAFHTSINPRIIGKVDYVCHKIM